MKEQFGWRGWGKVAGGAGGCCSQHDGVKRTPLEPTMGVMGWIDVDVYFEGWNGPTPAK